jgi:hypothetical protein
VTKITSEEDTNKKDTNKNYVYPEDQDCFWILKTHKDKKFLINITYMDIEGEPVRIIKFELNEELKFVNSRVTANMIF